MGRKKGRRSLKPPPATPVAALAPPHQEQQARTECFQGDRLTELLQRIDREIELQRLSKGGVPDKIWIKHLPSLASSRGIRVIFVRDKRGGSLKLGELVNLKTAMAIGVKVRGSGINKAVEEALGGMGEARNSLQT